VTNVRPQKRRDGVAGWGRRFVAGIARRIRRASFFMFACWLFSSAPQAFSLNGEGVEYPVKLAFLYNFTKFIEWPIGSYRYPDAPLALCIVGHDPFSAAIEGDLRTRMAGAHRVEVLTLKPTDALSGCHLAFIPATEKDQAGKIVRNLKGSSTLTVGETEGFAELGGMINLTVEGSKVHFEVNPLAAQRAGLTISSKLLSLAKIVIDNAR
jgi:YfiR/HmsC-like